jgi:hypothetical protein
MPPALEFQPETAEALALAADAPVELPPALAAPAGEERRAASSAAAAQLASVLTAPSRPSLSIIANGTGQVNSWSSEPTRLLDAKRFAELRALIESLVHTFLESYEAATQPALAVAPVVPGLPGGIPLAGSEAAQPTLQPGGGTPALQWQDSSAATISAIENRLALQIEQKQSTTTISQTRFALAQALWNTTDSPATQSRALALAYQTQAELRSAPDVSTVRALRQDVTDWIDAHDGPISKPGRLIDRGSGTNP